MIIHAARMRVWLLWAAPVMTLGGLGLRPGGAGAALALWAVIGALLPGKAHYPYPRKRRSLFHRLFFAIGAASLCHALLFSLILRFSPATPASRAFLLLGSAGAAGFSLPVGAWTLSFRLPRLVFLALGGLFCALSCWAAFL